MLVSSMRVCGRVSVVVTVRVEATYVFFRVKSVYIFIVSALFYVFILKYKYFTTSDGQHYSFKALWIILMIMTLIIIIIITIKTVMKINYSITLRETALKGGGGR